MIKVSATKLHKKLFTAKLTLSALFCSFFVQYCSVPRNSAFESYRLERDANITKLNFNVDNEKSLDENAFAYSSSSEQIDSSKFVLTDNYPSPF